jgi:hypothetical protein
MIDMKTLRVVISFVIFAQLSVAQGWLPQGARSMGVANTSVTLEDVFAYHHNPGALAFVPSFSAAVHYENRFLLRELQTQSFALALPTEKGAFSLGGQFYGYENFRTSRVGGGYSLLLAPNVALGVQLNYLNLRLDSFYGVRHGVSAEVGMLAKVNEDLTLGGSVVNIGNTRVSTITDDRFGTLIRLGAGYRLMENLTVLGEVAQYINQPTQLKGGVEYVFKEQFFIRIGASVQPVELSFGMGMKLGGIQLDLGSKYHAIVGWTPGVSFTYELGAKKEM